MTETQAQPSSLDVDSPESKLWTELLSATQRLEERDAELAATKAALAEADAVIFKLNSGEELQTLMKINNECVARISELEAALKLFAALVGHMPSGQ